MRVFLTGGPGLLGSHVAARLRADGHEVVALVRPTSSTRHLAALGCELVEGDVRDAPESLADLLRGCTHVVHSAALVYAARSWATVQEVNVGGTTNVLRAAGAAGVDKVVHISSVAVYGTVEGPVDEDTPLDAPLTATDHYARSKREAEAAARSAAEAYDLQLVILRPAAVYGEWDRLLSERLARMVQRPVTVTLGPGANTVPVVYAGNVADAVALALAAAGPGAVYDVGMDHPLTQRALLEGIARGMGRRPRFLPVPGALVRGGARLARALRVAAPGVRGLQLDRAVRLALGENPYPSHRLKRELGWTPPHEHEAALVRTGRWLEEYRANHEERDR